MNSQKQKTEDTTSNTSPAATTSDETNPRSAKSVPKKEKKKTRDSKPTLKQKKAFDRTLENCGNVSKAMREVGYSEAVAKNPQVLTQSKGWQQLMEEHLGDNDLAKKHKELLHAKRLEHMTFPPYNNEKAAKLLDREARGEDITEEEYGAQLTDADIRELLESVNCKVRRIAHGDMARHVYFWSPDTRATKDALDMAYKLKSRYGDEESKPPEQHVHFHKHERVTQIIGKAEEEAEKAIRDAI